MEVISNGDSCRRDETKDGDDTITWVGTRSWSSGKVGMVGGSYLGIVQWMVAHAQNPYLKVLMPSVAPLTLGRDAGTYRRLATYCNSNTGAGNSALQELPWPVIVNGRVNQNVEAYDMDRIAGHLIFYLWANELNEVHYELKCEFGVIARAA